MAPGTGTSSRPGGAVDAGSVVCGGVKEAML